MKWKKTPRPPFWSEVRVRNLTSRCCYWSHDSSTTSSCPSKKTKKIEETTTPILWLWPLVCLKKTKRIRNSNLWCWEAPLHQFRGDPCVLYLRKRNWVCLYLPILSFLSSSSLKETSNLSLYIYTTKEDDNLMMVLFDRSAVYSKIKFWIKSTSENYTIILFFEFWYFSPCPFSWRDVEERTSLSIPFNCLRRRAESMTLNGNSELKFS